MRSVHLDFWSKYSRYLLTSKVKLGDDWAQVHNVPRRIRLYRQVLSPLDKPEGWPRSGASIFLRMSSPRIVHLFLELNHCIVLWKGLCQPEEMRITCLLHVNKAISSAWKRLPEKGLMTESYLAFWSTVALNRKMTNYLLQYIWTKICFNQVFRFLLPWDTLSSSNKYIRWHSCPKLHCFIASIET